MDVLFPQVTGKVDLKAFSNLWVEGFLLIGALFENRYDITVSWRIGDDIQLAFPYNVCLPRRCPGGFDNSHYGLSGLRAGYPDLK
jgi:hypothetical protein